MREKEVHGKVGSIGNQRGIGKGVILLPVSPKGIILEGGSRPILFPLPQRI
jgi:hypothetical protein